MIDFLIQGYKATNTAYSGIVAFALKLNPEDVIAKEKFNADTVKLSGFNGDETALLKELFQKYFVNPTAILSYIANTNEAPSEIVASIKKYQRDNNLYFGEIEPLTDDVGSDLKEYPAAPFTYMKRDKENISLNDGSLLYTDEIATIKGKNGLDLNLTICYKSSIANLEDMTISNTGFNSAIAVLTTYGVGWEISMSSISSQTDGIYLKPAHGGVYKYSKGTNFSNLEDYQYKDMILEEDPYGQYRGSKYILTYKDGRREFFGGAGDLVGVKDKFDNTIDYKRAFQGTLKGSVLSELKITDSLNQVTLITSRLNENIMFNLPNGEQVTYERLFNKNDQPIITSKIDQAGRVTKFGYTDQGAKFNLYYNTPLYYKKEDGIRYYLNLTSVEYPTGVTSNYAYITRNSILGKYGCADFFKISYRLDIDKNNNFSLLNREYYSYSSYDATDIGRGQVPTPFWFYTQITYGNAVSRTYSFHSDMLESKEELHHKDKLISSKETKKEIINEIAVLNRPMRVNENITNTIYGNETMITKELYEYDGYLNTLNDWSLLAEGDKSNEEYKKTYTYDPKYHMLTSKTYKKDPMTTIVESYELIDDNRSVGSEIVKENGETKKLRTHPQ